MIFVYVGVDVDSATTAGAYAAVDMHWTDVSATVGAWI